MRQAATIDKIKDQIFSLLVVDDDDFDRQKIKRLIKKAGLRCEVSEAESVTHAINACGTNAFECAIVDYNMPGIDGLAGLAKLRSSAPDMSIIMSTGQGDEILAAEALRRGACDYIPKAAIDEDTIVSILHNTLERHHIRREMQEQRQALESFAYILAHDVRAPLRNIAIDSEMALRAFESGNREEAYQWHQKISRSVQFVNELVDALQAYNRLNIENIVFERMSLEAVAREAELLNEADLQAVGASVSYKDLPGTYAHRTQLRLLFQNLFENAIKYRSEHPLEIEIGTEVRDEKNYFYFKDNGIGIAEDHLDVIFSPFRRLHNQEDFPGTGLGLATCRKIVERHNGEIECLSERGAWTKFIFTLDNVQ